MKLIINAFLSLFLLTSVVAENKSHIDTETPTIQVAIIGGGIGGLSAAQITARRNLHTVVFQGDAPGGQMNNMSSVFNWLGVLECKGNEIVKAIKKQAISRGSNLSSATVNKVDLSKWPFKLHLSTGEIVKALSVIVATGAQFRKLHVPGEIEFENKGIISSVFESDKRWKGRTVVVVGSGDDAVRKAEAFAKVAKQVYIIVRGKELKVAPAVQNKLKNNYSNIQVLYGTTVSKIFGNSFTLQGVEIVNDATIKQLSCDIVSVAIGIEPQSHLFRQYISCNKSGYILLPGRTQETSVKGVFAVGDVTEDQYRKAVIAGSDGIKAGYDAAAFLKEKECDTLSEAVKHTLYKPE